MLLVVMNKSNHWILIKSVMVHIFRPHTSTVLPIFNPPTPVWNIERSYKNLKSLTIMHRPTSMQSVNLLLSGFKSLSFTHINSWSHNQQEVLQSNKSASLHSFPPLSRWLTTNVMMLCVFNFLLSILESSVPYIHCWVILMIWYDFIFNLNQNCAKAL